MHYVILQLVLLLNYTCIQMHVIKYPPSHVLSLLVTAHKSVKLNVAFEVLVLDYIPCTATVS